MAPGPYTTLNLDYEHKLTVGHNTRKLQEFDFRNPKHLFRSHAAIKWIQTQLLQSYCTTGVPLTSILASP